MEDSYSVSLGLRECGETIHTAVTDSITGELVDHYELTHPGGGTCVVAVYEKHLRCVLAFQVHARQRKVKCMDFVPVAFLYGFRSWCRR